MNRHLAFPALGLSVLLLLSLACEADPRPLAGPAARPEMREALFDSIVARTARRTAFSVPKQEAWSFDPLQAMEGLRDEVVEANTEEALFYALLRLSNARRDRHLSVGLVDGGIRPAFTDGLEAWSGPEPSDPLEAPVRFLPDFGAEGGGYFVSDLPELAGSPGEGALEPNATGDVAPEAPEGPGQERGDWWEGLEVGDRLLAVNGIPAGELETTLSPYLRHSTLPGLRWKLAEALSLRTAIFPPSFLRETLEVEVGRRDGSTIRASLPYLDPETLLWRGASDPVYPGFELRWSTPTYDLYLPTMSGPSPSTAPGRETQEGEAPASARGQEGDPSGSGPALPVLILQWHRFESSSLMDDVDRLVEFGAEEGILDHAVIVDATRSGGGSLGAYALQRIQPRPFKTTFGTLRLSDVIEPFVQLKREEFDARRVMDSGGPETVDDGSWLLDWLEFDVLDALARGDSVTTPVPFKLAHAPKDSDGVLQPAGVHFRRGFAVISGPSGGSHLDQFNAIVKDNALGAIVGMPAGGYSNTWEWEEVLTFPGTDRPVVGFMYDIGHTIRPNGEILEGNPATVDVWIPLTADGVSDYYPRLLAAALAEVRARR